MDYLDDYFFHLNLWNFMNGVYYFRDVFHSGDFDNFLNYSFLFNYFSNRHFHNAIFNRNLISVTFHNNNFIFSSELILNVYVLNYLKYQEPRMNDGRINGEFGFTLVHLSIHNSSIFYSLPATQIVVSYW